MFDAARATVGDVAVIKIAGRKIGPDHPPFTITDLGSNHDGSLKRAQYLIGRAADSGADAVKFQNFTASKLVSRRGFAELGKIGHQADWDQGVYEAYEAASIPLDWTPTLAACCKANGVAYLTTPYDLEAVDVIDPYVSAWKIGSGDITYRELIRYVASKGKPVILGTGAADEDDVGSAWTAYLSAKPRQQWDGNLVLLQCNSDYRGNSEVLRHANLRVLSHWGEDTHAVLGLSDHSQGHVAVCAAVALGACVIEKHFTDDKGRPGPDHAFAMEPEEWREMVAAARQTWEALGDGVKKVEENERDARIVQRRALRWAIRSEPGRVFPAGLTVRSDHVVATRPCPEGALEPYRLDEVVGRGLKRDVEYDTLVRLEDLE